MSELFVLQNQQKLFLGKQNAWVDGQDASALYKTSYKDEAINQMVEVSAKDYTQRIRIIPCTIDEKGLPVIDPGMLPEPQPKSVDMFAGVESDNPKQEDAQPKAVVSDEVVSD